MTELWERTDRVADQSAHDQASQGYLQARRLSRASGSPKYWATLLLPKEKRPYVHALHGFVRYANSFAHHLDPTVPEAERVGVFDQWRQRVLADIEKKNSTEPITAAVLDTIRRWQIPTAYFADFLDSVEMDLHVTRYETYPQLSEYMWGASGVLALQLLPILGPRTDNLTSMKQTAISLTQAFQLTSFVRNLGDDLDRGHLYFPQEALGWFGLDREHLMFARKIGQVDSATKRLLALEVERARQCYRRAAPGITRFEADSQSAIRIAMMLHREILDRVEQADYQVLAKRISLGRMRRAQLAVEGFRLARRVDRGTRRRNFL